MCLQPVTAVSASANPARRNPQFHHQRRQAPLNAVSPLFSSMTVAVFSAPSGQQGLRASPQSCASPKWIPCARAALLGRSCISPRSAVLAQSGRLPLQSAIQRCRALVEDSCSSFFTSYRYCPCLKSVFLPQSAILPIPRQPPAGSDVPHASILISTQMTPVPGVAPARLTIFRI